MTPENLCSILKVDGILFSELFDYTDVFFINHSIKMHFKLFDVEGDSLWVNDLDDVDRPFLSALGALVGWAIGISLSNKTSSKDKVPIILAGVAAAELIYVTVDADAVLYMTIEEWDTQYLVLFGSLTVKAKSELKSTSSGELFGFMMIKFLLVQVELMVVPVVGWAY